MWGQLKLYGALIGGCSAKLPACLVHESSRDNGLTHAWFQLLLIHANVQTRSESPDLLYEVNPALRSSFLLYTSHLHSHPQQRIMASSPVPIPAGKRKAAASSSDSSSPLTPSTSSSTSSGFTHMSRTTSSKGKEPVSSSPVEPISPRRPSLLGR